MFKHFWAIALIVLPIFHRDFITDYRLQKNVVFLFVAILSLILFKHRQNKLISLIAILLTIKIFLSNYIFASVFVLEGGLIQIEDHGEITGKAFFQSIQLLISLGLVNQFVLYWDESLKKYLTNALSISCVINSLWIIAQYYHHDPLIFIYYFKDVNGIGDISGALDNGMVTGSLMGIISPFLFRKYWCFFIPVFIYAIFLLGSAMSWLGLCVGIFYFILRNFKLTKICKYLLAIIPIFFLIVNYFKDFFQDSGRYEAWKHILTSEKLLLFGHPIGFYTDHGWQKITSVANLRHPHNEFILGYYTFGIIGVLFIFILLLWIFQWHKENPYFSASFLSFLAVSNGSFPLHIGSTAIIFIIGIAILLHHALKSEQCKKLLNLLRWLDFQHLSVRGSCLEMIRKWTSKLKYLKIS